VEVKLCKYIFSILLFRGIFIATLITLCFIPINDLEINKLNFVVGHGTVVQLACTTIRLWCKQAQQDGRTHQLGFCQICQLECTKQLMALGARVHHSQVEHIDFHAFYKKCGLQRDFISCFSCLTLKRR